MSFKKLLVFISTVLVTMSFDYKSEPEKEFVEHLLSQMTLEEKLGQMTLYSSGEDPTVPVFNPSYRNEISAGRCGAVFASITRQGIEELQELALQSRLKIPMMFGYDVIHGFETIFPIPLAEAASWNTELIESAAKTSAIEATYKGINWFFGPMIDVARDARWGRVSEGAGEDPYLVSQVARAKVRGYQQGNLASDSSVAACAKHFVAYGMPLAGRDYNTVIISDQELKDVYLKPFDAAVDEGLATVMSAFNEINGIPCSANKNLLKGYLMDERGFDGCVVTDFATIREFKNHGISDNDKHSAALALEAGVHIDMESALYNVDHVDASHMEEIDDAVRRILTLKYRLGLFEDPFRYCHKEGTPDYESHRADAYALGAESIVLLKNEGEVLPLETNLQKIAVVGPLANNKKDMLGTWVACGDTSEVVTVLDGIKKAFPNTRVSYAQGVDIDSEDISGIAAATRLARKSDLVIAVLGEKGDMAGEAASKGNITLPGKQLELLKSLHETGKKVILVLTNGRPLILTEAAFYCDAIVEAWQLGTVAGHVIADVLSGKINPSGKLPMTFPAHVGQLPIYYAQKNTGRPSDPEVRYTSRYLDIPFQPLYPFGYGLSYTDFEITALTLTSESMDAKHPLGIKVNVTNTGKADGKETIQLYVRDLVGSVTRPVRELKGFKKVFLKKGESCEVEFQITIKDLMFANADGKRISEPGKYQLFVGNDSNARLEAGFELLAEPQEEDGMPMETVISKAMERAEVQCRLMAEYLSEKPDSLPRTFVSGKNINSDSHWWCSGFFPGSLWQLYQYDRNPEILAYAEKYTERVRKEMYATDNHDIGFMIFCSFGNAYRLTGNRKYLPVIETACHSLSTRYDENIGLIRSWDFNSDLWQYPVIIDNMMNLEMLMWGAEKFKKEEYRNMAESHADKTLENHFRPDYSSFHLVSYDRDSGLPELKQTWQGAADSSAWARGQAWGLYGYTYMFRFTKNEKYLQQARHIARFMIDHPQMPADLIPYWDYNAPDIPYEPRDASAAALMASALIELSNYVEGKEAEEYLKTAERQIRELSSDEYLAEKGTNGFFILRHSVGSKPHQNTPPCYGEVDAPLSYADYYYLEAMNRWILLHNKTK